MPNRCGNRLTIQAKTEEQFDSIINDLFFTKDSFNKDECTYSSPTDCVFSFQKLIPYALEEDSKYDMP